MVTRSLAEASAGVAASRPAAASTNSGDLYYATDTGVLWRSTGSAWAMVSAQPTASYLGNVAYREAFPIFQGDVNITGLTTGVMYLVGIGLFAGDVVTSLSFVSGATALTQGTNNDGHWWFALYDPTVTLLAQSADQTTAAWAANSVKTLALSAAQTIAATGWHYAALMVNPGTGGSPAVPTLRGRNIAATVLSTATGWPTGKKQLAGSNGSALGATAPAGPISPSAQVTAPYALAT